MDAFIAVSHFGADSMAEYLGIDRDRIHVVPLGMNFDGFECGNARDAEPFTIGYLARIAPEKGLHFLCDAYRLLSSPWRAFSQPLVGSRLSSLRNRIPISPAYEQALDSWGLSDQFRYHGELDRREKLNFLKSLSVFSVPEIYDDPKGSVPAGGSGLRDPRRATAARSF